MLFNKWVDQLKGKGRVLTKKLASEVCYQLRKKFNMNRDEDTSDEDARMHNFLKMARKRRLGIPIEKPWCTSKCAMSSVDNMETLIMEHTEEDR